MKPTYEELERRIAELRKKEELFRMVNDFSGDFFMLFDKELRLIYANKAAIGVTGSTEENCVGKTNEEIGFPKDVSEIWDRQMRNVLDSGEPDVYEFWVNHNGVRMDMEIKLSPVLSPDGDTIGVFGISRDITEHKKTERALRNTESFIRSINDNLFNGMIYQAMILPDGGRKITYLSDKVKFFYGITPEEGVADAGLIYGRFHKDDYKRLREEEEKAFSNLSTFNVKTRVVCPNGEIRWSHFISHPKKKSDGKIVWNGIEFDITENVKAEEELNNYREHLEKLVEERTRELKKQEKKHASVISNIPAVVWTSDQYGNTTFIGPNVSRVIGFTPEEIYRDVNIWFSRIHKDDAERVKKSFAALFTKNVAYEQEYRFQRKDGQWIWLRDRSISTYEEGGVFYADGVFSDITERVRSQADKEELRQQLNQSQKMEAIGQLAGGIAHDFNNIIATISGTAELLISKTPGDAPIIKQLERIRNSSRRAKDLTMKLLTFARKEKLNVKTIHPNDIASDVMDVLKSTTSSKINITYQCGENGLWINADSNQIFHALLNICLNACDSMPHGGELKIRIYEEFMDGATAAERNLRGGGYVVIDIEDTGTGVDKDNIDKIFEPFFTTKDRGKGSGLGLSISHGIVEAHGGFIKVRSEKGEGTTFSVFLPAADSIDIATDEERKTVSKTAKGNLLIIDDDRDFVQMMQDLFEEMGFKITTALSGPEAIDYYRGKAEEVDVILMDMLLPEMSGTEIFYALKELNPAAKIILCSGYSIEGDASTLLDKGALAFVQKPFDVAEVVDIISANIRKEQQ